MVRAIYSVSIGLGGDSSINIKDNKMQIGPKREGKPYAFGGPRPTPTDAMIYLDLIDDVNANSKERAKKAIGDLANELNLSSKGVAELIFETMADMIKNKTDELLLNINNKPVYTVKGLLHGKKIEPKVINIIGGPANLLATVLEEKYKLPCFFPDNYHVANAVGAALARPTIEITMLADTSKGILSVPELGIYEDIGRKYSLNQAKKRAIQLLKESAISMGVNEEDIESEITEESSFNMVDGFYTKGKNIRIKAQIKPGFILKLRSGNQDEG